MELQQILTEAKSTKLGKKLEKAGLDIDTINNQGKNALNDVESEIKKAGGKPEAIKKKGMKLGQNKSLPKTVKKAHAKQANKLMKDLTKSKLIGSDPSPSLLISSFILLLHSMSIGMTQRLKVSGEQAYIITATSLCQQISLFDNLDREKGTPIDSLISWIKPIKAALSKYKNKDLQKILIAYIITSSDLSFLRKAWETSKSELAMISATGVGSIAVLGSAGTLMGYHTWNAWIRYQKRPSAHEEDYGEEVESFMEFLQYEATWNHALDYSIDDIRNIATDIMNYTVELGKDISNKVEELFDKAGNQFSQVLDKVSDAVNDFISSSSEIS